MNRQGIAATLHRFEGLQCDQGLFGGQAGGNQRGQDRQGVEYHVVATGAQAEVQWRATETGRDLQMRGRGDTVDQPQVGLSMLAVAELGQLRAPGGIREHLVVRHVVVQHRVPAGRHGPEDRAFLACDILQGAVVLQMCRRQAGDHGNVRAYQLGVDRHPAHGHFQHPKTRWGGHARQVPGDAVGQIGVAFGLCHRSQLLQGMGEHRDHRGLAGAAGDAEHLAAEVQAGMSSHLQHRFGSVGDLQHRQAGVEVGRRFDADEG